MSQVPYRLCYAARLQYQTTHDNVIVLFGIQRYRDTGPVGTKKEIKGSQVSIQSLFALDSFIVKGVVGWCDGAG